jgi:hypothetical protein
VCIACISDASKLFTLADTLWSVSPLSSQAGGASSPPPSTAGLKPVTITFVTLTKSKIVAKAFPGQSLREVAAEAKVHPDVHRHPRGHVEYMTFDAVHVHSMETQDS